MGSITIRRTPDIASTVSHTGRMSRSRRQASSRSSPRSRPLSTQTRDGSPPMATRRGRMVSAGSSSAESSRTLPGLDRLGRPSSPRWPRSPVVTRAASSSVRYDLPRPGSPASSVTLPRATRSGHNHETGRGVSVARLWTTAEPIMAMAGLRTGVAVRRGSIPAACTQRAARTRPCAQMRTSAGPPTRKPCGERRIKNLRIFRARPRRGARVCAQTATSPRARAAPRPALAAPTRRTTRGSNPHIRVDPLVCWSALPDPNNSTCSTERHR